MKNLNFKSKDQKGFTLVELLIVIVIIGILTSLGVANFVGARERARDAKRKSDFSQIALALENYKIDSISGAYPAASAFVCGNALSNAAGTVYMKKIPCDPTNASPFVYAYAPGGSLTTYTLNACLENVNDKDKFTGWGPSCSVGVPYVVTNP